MKRLIRELPLSVLPVWGRFIAETAKTKVVSIERTSGEYDSVPFVRVYVDEPVERVQDGYRYIPVAGNEELFHQVGVACQS
jgi:hypothetical protein